jgi:hypothetical protein
MLCVYVTIFSAFKRAMVRALSQFAPPHQRSVPGRLCIRCEMGVPDTAFAQARGAGLQLHSCRQMAGVVWAWSRQRGARSIRKRGHIRCPGSHITGTFRLCVPVL